MASSRSLPILSTSLQTASALESSLESQVDMAPGGLKGKVTALTAVRPHGIRVFGASRQTMLSQTADFSYGFVGRLDACRPALRIFWQKERQAKWICNDLLSAQVDKHR